MRVILETRNLTKVFGSFKANDGISIQIQKNSIHGIVGENGSGKSTLLKMLFGLYSPSSGEILVNGQARSWNSPLDAIDAGLGMVQQHFSLVGNQTALENVILGSEPIGRFGRIDRTKALARIQSLLPAKSLDVPWDEKVENLSVGYRQRIELMKVLYRDAQVLFLDEPTAVLTPQETDDFFAVLRKLKADGRTIVLISHKLREIFDLCDNVSVIRKGQLQITAGVQDLSTEEVVRQMMGRAREPLTDPRPPPRSEILVESSQVAESVVSRGMCKDISLNLRGGEILGVAGVEGAGQRNFIECLLGLRPHTGQIKIKNQVLSSTSAVRAAGVGMIPEERVVEGLWPEENCYNNMIIGLEDQFAQFSFLDRDLIRTRTTEWAKSFDVRAESLDSEAQILSGGNQQKLIFAREVLGRKPDILICYQPTRGVDLGAIDLLHQRLLDLRSQGVGILLISSEVDELMLLSDRIAVFYEGAVSQEFSRKQFDRQKMGAAMTGKEGA